MIALVRHYLHCAQVLNDSKDKDVDEFLEEWCGKGSFRVTKHWYDSLCELFSKYDKKQINSYVISHVCQTVYLNATGYFLLYFCFEIYCVNKFVL